LKYRILQTGFQGSRTHAQKDKKAALTDLYQKLRLEQAKLYVLIWKLGGYEEDEQPDVGYRDKALDIRESEEVSDMKNSCRVIPAGISGNFISPHYDDQTELWRRGKYRPFVLDRKNVEQDARYTLIMFTG
jgi:hypothetical protein